MLNPEQLELKKQINEFISGKDNGFFGVLGAGGTGKTHTVCESIPVKKAIFLGATNKVVGVLKHRLKSNGLLGVEAKTLDSFFGFKMERDHENKTTTTHTMPPMHLIPDIIVVDEISLINDEVCNLLLQLKSQRKVILMGDDMQLPPISNDDSKNGFVQDGFKKSLIFKHFNKVFTLTIQVRQKDGSALHGLIKGFRDFMHTNLCYKKIAKFKSNKIDVQHFMDTDPEFREILRTKDVTCVCYKNITALSFNWLIGAEKTRSSKYLVNEIATGDTVFFDSFYKNGDVTFFTSELVEILEIEENCVGTFKHEDIEIQYPYKKIKVKRKDDEAKFLVHVGYGFKDTNSSIYSQLNYGRTKIKKNFPLKIEDKKKLAASFTAYNDFTLGLAKLKKPFGITSHKAQGSTFDHVIVPIYDYGNRNFQDSNQLFYVAMSRAKESIIFVDRRSTFLNNSSRQDLSEFEKNAICSTHNYKCNHCGKEEDDIRAFNIHHKEKLAKGMNALFNLEPLCKDCFKSAIEFEKQSTLFSA